ncbi:MULTISPECIES: orotidine-5'-phosphate decarboxylase [Aliarcobacter]|jgi:orotidine-5'-phosphate decarboxylase|uniref:Orotidine 5'-phosphate decarboxylase n=2 Tax=Aliarcobacter skirrowii TaxID=28200 RepID=A0AAD0SM16_9BACT|nr:orotidine-5'-phosphate decarboxylase [Aliarcobacter skirrowii]AXX84661.1 orotidine-5'-phosphate decarboxylase [Aliarcobacter skirrowii CCUG 10374]KAB0620206.1 orotidine-5'-phosphate decarboxylase [Aliarcobacter skirrowii CCUG 10374]MDX4039645.1 orotidine-5'-phosphate decarboxylase [Aliarcobacter skirrowii]MDX4060601.1 orotidine-5'-phosphate decarboxylase [Aliarcobacter skirrowii]MDX4062510.1 orotidine-5'-phosphate decarboxylase [Aliarcobacter skirrowii]
MSKDMKLCLSLDLESKEENLALVEKLKNFDMWLKVGFRTYLRDGKKFLEDLKAINPDFKIFLDLKLYDIPNTMADAAFDISKFGLVDMFNVHASAGIEAMKTVMNRIKDIPNRPLVLAVTALTSFDNESFKKIYGEDIDKKAREFAKNTFEAGLDGVVCSAFESLDIKNNTSKDFITLCPGIRPFGEDSGDQKRVADIKFSKDNLVDFIVVGRPIYKSENPELVVKKILENI